MSADPRPATFIGRYGLVRYNGRLPGRFPRDGPCELGLCRLLRAADLDSARAGKRVAERRLAQIGRQLPRLDARHAGLLAWQPGDNGERRQRRRELEASRRRRGELAAEARRLTAVTVPAYEAMIAQVAARPSGRGAMLVFDHCHAHGWVRGVIRMACNNALISLEQGRGSVHRGAEVAALLRYLTNCPDCPPDGPPARVLPVLWGCKIVASGHPHGTPRSATLKIREVSPHVLRERRSPGTTGVRPATMTNTTPAEMCGRSFPRGT
jgi:hypothetical protein